MAGLLAPQIKFRYTDNNGFPLVGGKVYTYVTGTNTLQLSYKDSALTVPNTNPIILDSRGECDIYLQGGKAYRFTVKDVNDVLINTTDGIFGASAAGGQEWIDLLAFGADPTGVIDSTAAIQAALTAATTAPRRTLYVPAGTYLMTSGVTINGRITMVGDGLNNSVFSYNNRNGAAFSWTADGTYSSFDGIKLINPNTPALGDTSTGFRTFQGAACVLYLWDKCWVEGFGLWGIELNDSFNCSFTNGRLRKNGVRASLAGLGNDGQGGGMLLQRITFSGAATTGNDYSNSYITGNNFGIKIFAGGNNNKAFNTRLDNVIFEENYIGLDLRNLGTGGQSRYCYLNTCYFEANLFAGAMLDEASSVACYQNDTVAGTGIPPSWSLDGKDGINFSARYLEDRPSRFRVGNNAAAPYNETQNVAFAVDKGELTNYVSKAVFNEQGAIILNSGAGSAPVTHVTIQAGMGSPEGARTANSGSLYLNKGGAFANNILYLKSSDASNTGWITIGTQFGATADRPAADASNKGQQYYDTDILRVVTSNGAGVWREYNGLSSVTGTLAAAPSRLEGAMYWANDAKVMLVADGTIWRTMYAVPTFTAIGNGGTLVIGTRDSRVVNTGSAIASATVTLPGAASAASGDIVTFSTNGAITALTINAGAGATVVGATTTMTANSSVEYIYNAGVTTWYKVR